MIRTYFRVKSFSLTCLILLCLVQLTTHGEDRVSLTGFSGTGVGTPFRMGGEISLETDRLFFKHLTLGYLGLLPLDQNRESFEIFPSVKGFDGYFLGLRHRFQHESITPFIGISFLGHFLAEKPYVSLNPEVGVSIRCHKDYELSAQLRYFMISYGRSDDFLTIGFGLTRVF